MPSTRTVAIIGASSDRRKFGNKAVRAYVRAGWQVFPVHPTETSVEGLPAFRQVGEIAQLLDVVTLYVPPAVGERLLAEIASVQPREMWLNPGASSPALREAARALALPVIEGCSILSLGHSPRDFPDA